jgi:general secretion pathway protein A
VNDHVPGAHREAAAALPAADGGRSLTYEPFFGLSEKPFSLSADPRFLFRSPSHGPVFDSLLNGIRRREGLISLTGEIGTGKTTLCRAVLHALDRRTFASFIPDPFVSREDLLKMLLVDFGVISIGDLKRGRLRGASRSELSYLLYEFLDSLVALQAFAVVVLDEAQNLPLPLLEEIRILSELERREKLLHVVLVGQPELRAHLRLPEMRQVEQRISVRCELTALDGAGVAGYVAHRLAVAGRGASRVEFTSAGLDAVFQVSSGVPRVINRICDRALDRAYAARCYRIDAAAVWEAAGRHAPDAPVATPQPPVPAPESSRVPSVELRARTPEFQVQVPAVRSRRAGTTVRVAVAASLGVISVAVGTVWYPDAQAPDREAIVAMLPPAPPAARPAGAITVPGVDDAMIAGSPAAGAAAASGLAAEEGYVIQVASFESRLRAARLVDELTSAGYRARDVELDLGAPRGRLVQVIVGGYTSALEVERDLRRIREWPGYADARLLER